MVTITVKHSEVTVLQKPINKFTSVPHDHLLPENVTSRGSHNATRKVVSTDLHQAVYFHTYCALHLSSRLYVRRQDKYKVRL